MNILIDARSYFPGRQSGISLYVKFVIEHLLRADDENNYSLFANSFWSRSAELEMRDRKVRILNYHIPNRMLDLGFKFFNTPKIDKLTGVDLVYSPHINILGLENRERHIITVHDLSFVHFPQFFSLPSRFWHWRQNYKNQIKKAGRIITDSESTAEDVMRTFGVRSERITKIYPGLNHAYKNLNLKRERFLLYLGALEPRKNITGIIRAFNIIKDRSSFSDLKLVIAGSKGWLYKEIFKEAFRSKFNKDIDFLGKVSEEEALRLYNTASVFVYPSFYEGFGFPPLEAQACGLPVVASSRSSLPEILGNSALLADPWRIDEIVMGIEALLTEDKLRNIMVERGLENVKRFSWEETVKSLMEVFNGM